MPDNYRDAIEQWQKRIGAGKVFHEQELWRERAPLGRGFSVAYCNTDRRLAIKKILIAGLRANLVDGAGPGQWVFL